MVYAFTSKSRSVSRMFHTQNKVTVPVGHPFRHDALTRFLMLVSSYRKRLQYPLECRHNMYISGQDHFLFEYKYGCSLTLLITQKWLWFGLCPFPGQAPIQKCHIPF